MKGTEKQIAYARDILADTTKKVNETIESLIRRYTVPGYGMYKAAQTKVERYKKALEIIAEENWENAGDVIENHKAWNGLFEMVSHYVNFPDLYE